jgi:pullulanase/glycogen debranching enzyme
MKSVVVDPFEYDWEGDSLLHRPSSQTIIYETLAREVRVLSKLVALWGGNARLQETQRE